MSSNLNALPTTYVSQPVIPLAPNAPDDRGHSWDSPATDVASKAGPLDRTVDVTHGSEMITLNFVGLTRSDARTLEAFVDTQKGRKSGFWSPSFQQDYVAVAAIAGHPAGQVVLREYGQKALLPPQTIFYSSATAFSHVACYRGSAAGVKWYINRMGLDTDDGTTDAVGNVLVGYGFAIGGPEAGNSAVLTAPNTFDSGLRLMRLLWCRLADDAVTTAWDHPHLASMTIRVVSILGESP